MSSPQIYQTLDGDSGIAALLEMIERKAPHFMKVGGGGLTKTVEATGRAYQPMTEDDKAKIERLNSQGVPLSVIAREVKRRTSTVRSHVKKVERVP